MSAFFFDIETLGKESTTVVLSAAMTYVPDDCNMSYEELLDNTTYVKFNAFEQIQVGRTKDQDTIDWWKGQPLTVKIMSFIPNPEIEVSVEEGLNKLRNFYTQHAKSKVDIVWIRGALDNLAIDSLADKFNQKIIAPWWNYRDVRTAIDLLKTTGARGYCNIPDFDKSKVIKHNPIHDCAYDAMMLLYGE